MKKILAILGSPRKGESYKAVQAFERELKSREEMDFEYLFLKDYDLGTCRGCFLCLSKGEKYCPLKDDRDVIIEKMMAADGVIFATPNYSLQVTAIMKNFFDRLAFIFHRPCFFYKSATAIVTQGVYGGGEITKYLATLAEFWGFRVVKGIVLTTPPGIRLPVEQNKIDKKIANAALGFHRALSDRSPYRPTLKRLAIFHASRTSHRVMSDRSGADYNYFKEQGWLESDFFCEARLNPAQKLVGKAIDRIIAGQLNKTKKEQEAYRENAAAVKG